MQKEVSRENAQKGKENFSGNFWLGREEMNG
jgi:hypothetical protein